MVRDLQKLGGFAFWHLEVFLHSAMINIHNKIIYEFTTISTWINYTLTLLALF